ncbi:Detected protein of confused Function [Hibiscus syriacus]|uniref:Detected protein of confused Function n=1 Tax=Hibiscus syriacus TaxID=106335 RepID=A0A6A3C7V5_HIBSY|nr:Detected protein of confused Function [Hibiscus syriacus]
MDPLAFIRLSIDSLGLRIRGTPLGSSRAGIRAFSAPCSCEIRLQGFPVQTTVIPLVLSPEAMPDVHSIASSFYLEESDLKSLLTPGCFYNHHAYLEITVFTGRKGTHFGVGVKRHQIGTFKLAVGPEWGEGKPVILFNGWIGIGKNKHENGKPGAELHLRVKLDPDPRYVFRFEDATVQSPQIVQLQGAVKQPIFSCEFSRDRVVQVDSLNTYLSGSGDNLDIETGRRERKGWKVKIHDLSGSAVAAAFITTPFVPSTGQRAGCLGENSRHGVSVASETMCAADFTCCLKSRTEQRVYGESKSSKPSVQLAMRHVTCIEDAAIFMALAAAVDLSIEACKPFRRKPRRGSRHSYEKEGSRIFVQPMNDTNLIYPVFKLEPLYSC